MESIKDISDYDILTDKPKADGGDYNWEDYDDHIGNGRFEVLIDMYHEAFAVSLSRELEEESQKIIDRIFDVVCHKDIITAETPGRFLVKVESSDPTDIDDVWNELDEEEAKVLVRQALIATPRPEEEDDEPTFVPVPEEEPLDSYEERKRPRRRSLLRRSASESHVEDNKKKPNFRQGGMGVSMESIRGSFGSTRNLNPSGSKPFAPDSIRSSVPPPIGGGTVAQPSGMDVILASNRRKLSSKPNIVANNRLQVMLALQKDRYRKLPPEEQEKVAVDMVKAVCNYWGGRILVETGFSYFMKLEKMEAVICIKALLTAESMQSEDDGAIQLGHSPMGTGPSVLANVPQPPEFLRNSSMEILNNGATGTALNMQSAAVKSLQQRKAKRGLAKKLGQGAPTPDVTSPGSFPPTFMRLNNVDTAK